MLSAILIQSDKNCRIWSSDRGITPSVKRLWLCLYLVCAVSGFLGCRSINKPKIRNTSPLSVLEKAPSQTELEVVFVRIPPRDQESTNLLWQEVDELAVDAKFRRELHKNGFRVGLGFSC